MELKGPQRFIKKTGEIKDLKYTDIENVTLQLQGKKYYLLQNNIKIHYDKNKNDIMVYHMYNYLDNGKEQFGRWYKWFKTLPIKENKFIIKMEEYEDETGKNIGPVTISITFNDNAIKKIQKFILQTK
jgi:hypothetical protein